MKTITLRLTYRDDTDLLAELSWAAGRTRIATAVDTLRPELERFISEGLSEWVGPESDPQPRTTSSSDQRFLDRLATYLRRQFNFVIEIQQNEPQTPQTKRTDTVQWPPQRGVPVRQSIGSH